MRVSVDLDKGREFLSANPYTMRQELTLPPGQYTAKAIVRVVGTDKTGFARKDFVIPESGNGPAPVSSIPLH
jgi:hypothetical protein